MSAGPGTAAEPILSIRDLVVDFPTDDGIVHAVDHVSYDVFPGEALGVVDTEGLYLEMTEPMRQAVIRPVGDVKFLMVIMPMSLQ